MTALILLFALIISLAVNGYQWHKWHSYRARPAGVHSHTGMMQAIKVKR